MSRPGITFAPPIGFSNEQYSGPGIYNATIYQPVSIYLFDQQNYSDFFPIRCYPDNNNFSYCRSAIAISNLMLKIIIAISELFDGPYGLIGKFDQTPSSNETALIQASDLFIPKTGPSFALWVKQNQLKMIAYGGSRMVPLGAPPPTPASPFPFARFAAINSSAFYLYHQINSTVFAEDVWDSAALNWVSSENITISTWT